MTTFRSIKESSMAKTIMNTQEGICYLCGAEVHTEVHHCIGGPNRWLSEKHGLKVDLCVSCHKFGRDAVHHNGSQKKKQLQAEAQRMFEQKKGTREEFMRIFGRNYIMEEDDDGSGAVTDKG